MRPRTIPLLFPMPAYFVLLFLVLALLLTTLSAWSSQSPPPPTPLTLTDRTQQHDDSAYNEPIIFFEEDSTVLVFYPNGDIIYRGRKLTKDYEVVRALQEILSLSPCRRQK